MGKGERREYPPEFKRAAVKLIVDTGDSIANIARSCGLNQGLLRRWKRELDQQGAYAFPGKGRRPPQSAELHRLREANRRLQLEREILRLAGPLLQDHIRVRLAFIHEHRHQFPTRILCEVLNVSRSGYYSYAKSRNGSSQEAHFEQTIIMVPVADVLPPSAEP